MPKDLTLNPAPRAILLGMPATQIVVLSCERARLHRLRKNTDFYGFVTGHDFSRATKPIKSTGLYRLRKNPGFFGLVTGHDFSRADKANRMREGFCPSR